MKEPRTGWRDTSKALAAFVFENLCSGTSDPRMIWSRMRAQTCKETAPSGMDEIGVSGLNLCPFAWKFDIWNTCIPVEKLQTVKNID